MTARFLLVIAFFLTCCAGFSQDSTAPFYRDIREFKRIDSISFPSPRAILFIGSSSFTKWTDVQDYFPRHLIINRGFGGSSLPDVIRYADDIIFPYKPSQVIIYCGENDLAGADSITAEIVFNRFKQLFTMTRSRLPGASIGFVSMKPSPSREKIWPKMIAANAMIKDYLRTKKRTAYIDVFSKMFNPDGTVIKEIFLEDNLHMNAKGYAIWKKVMEPFLLPDSQAKRLQE